MHKRLTLLFRMRPAWLRWAAISLFLVWLFYSLSMYYVVHKPFSLPVITYLVEESSTWLRFTVSATAVVRTALDLGAAGWLIFVSLGTGIWLLQLICLQTDSQLEIILYSLGLGFGFLGLATLLLGLAGILQPIVFYGLIILLTLITGPRTLRLLWRIRIVRPSPLIVFYLGVAIGLALVVALLPPTSWDALFYHLKGPKLYLEAGRIRPGIDIPHLNFPSLFEMLFLMAMAIRGDVTAKLVHFVFNLMLADLVFSISRQELKLRNGWVSVLFLYATPMILTLAGWAYNDLALAFYQVAALAAVLRWRTSRRRNWLVLSGILCGFAMSLKYTSFIAPLSMIGIIAWETRRQGVTVITRTLLTMALPAAIVAAPWYLKNWLFTGNPVYPFLFNGRFWNDFRSGAYSGSKGIGLDPVALLRLPHDLTLGLNDASHDGPTGPFFLIFLPLILVYAFTERRKQTPPAFTLLLIFALAQYLFWTLGVTFSAGLWQSRLLLSAFVSLCPAMAWIWQDLGRFDLPQFSLKRFVSLTLGLSLTLNLIAQLLLWMPQAPLAYVLGNEPREERLRRYLGNHYAAMEGINNELPQDAVIAFLWEPRSYYCDRDCRPDSILDTFTNLEHQHHTPSSIAETWNEEGITHVLLHDDGLEFVVNSKSKWIAPRDPALLPALLHRYFTPIQRWGESYTLYELKS